MRKLLRKDRWERIAPMLPGKAGDPGRTGADNRLFMEAVLWIARTGAPWRDLPQEFGPWNSVYIRFARWSKRGVWEAIFSELAKDADLREAFLEFRHCPSPPACSASSKKNHPQALGRSRGGLTTKTHALVESKGQLAGFTLTGGEVHD